MRHHILSAFAALFTLIALIGSAARMLPANWQTIPYVPIIIAVCPWFALLALVALIFALISHRWFTALIAIAIIALQCYWHAPLFHKDTEFNGTYATTLSSAANTTDSYARVMTLNVYKGNADVQQIVDTVKQQRVEVLAMQETTDEFVDELTAAGIEQYLPYSIVSSSDGVYGNGIWSATPLSRPVDTELNSSASFMPAGTISFDNDAKPIRFVSVHTTSPTPTTWNLWKTSLDELRSLQTNTDVRYVLMGDFNATLDHAPFRDLLGTRFTDAALESGSGFHFTWPADITFVPALAQIDHIVLDNGIEAGDISVKTIAGSDHKALLATIEIQ